MNRIILIGNGFDLAHGLKTKYKDFVAGFWLKELEKIKKNSVTDYSVDEHHGLLHFTYHDNFIRVSRVLEILDDKVDQGKSQVEKLKARVDYYNNSFLEIIEKDFGVKDWVDIEELYYKQLLVSKDLFLKNGDTSSIKKLNQEFEEIKKELEDYLSKIEAPQFDDRIAQCIHTRPLLSQKINKILFLNFNYTTKTENLYFSHETTGQGIEAYYLIDKERKKIKSYFSVEKPIHIHGEIGNPNNKIIFGYGDELDKDYSEIENLNVNEFLENVKSVLYANTGNYSKLLEFISDSEPFEIFVFGHSCGNADRTLLNTLFTKCERIKFFYYKYKDGNDNFGDISKNISRCFGDQKEAYRKKLTKNDEDYLSVEKESEEDKKEKDSTERDKSKDVKGIEFIKVEKGEFVMGAQKEDKNKDNYDEDAFDDEQPRKVTIENDFYISKTPVTQKQWNEIMTDKAHISFFKGRDDLPVEEVSWYYAIDFCNRLTALNDKLTPYYKFTKKEDIEAHPDDWINTGANGYRLPTEAEWEYAVRGGNKSRGYKYSGCNNREELRFYAWFDENSQSKTQPVGRLLPNELGLHDMSGNVWEWCEDWYDSDKTGRVLRGGSWSGNAGNCRVSYRGSAPPDFRYFNFGFRLVCSL